jgi:hypothetical protein
MKFSISDLLRWTVLVAITVDACLRSQKAFSYVHDAADWHNLVFWAEVTIGMLVALFPLWRPVKK